MEIMILPNFVRDAINKKLDEAIEKNPGAEKYRDIFFDKLLTYFYDNNEIPDFILTKKEASHDEI